MIVLIKLKEPAGQPLMGSNAAVSTPEEARELVASGARHPRLTPARRPGRPSRRRAGRAFVRPATGQAARRSTNRLSTTVV